MVSCSSCIKFFVFVAEVGGTTYRFQFRSRGHFAVFLLMATVLVLFEEETQHPSKSMRGQMVPNESKRVKVSPRESTEAEVSPSEST